MKKDAHRALLVKVFCELGRGNVFEDYIIADTKNEYIDGMTLKSIRRTGSRKVHRLKNPPVIVNPVRTTLETLIHELLHRIYPKWSENYVRRTTTYLWRRMSDEEMQVLYAEYQKRAKKAIKTA